LETFINIPTASNKNQTQLGDRKPPEREMKYTQSSKAANKKNKKNTSSGERSRLER